MERACYLEVFSPHTSLKEAYRLNYWNEYWNKIVPEIRKQGLESTITSFVVDRISPMVVKNQSLYPIHHKVEGDIMYVYNDGTFNKNFIPDAWITLFSPSDLTKNFVANDLENKSYTEIVEYQHGSKTLTFESRLELVKKNLKSRIMKCKESGTSDEFNNHCSSLLNWLKDMHDDSIVRIYSGEILFNEPIESFVSYNPFEVLIDHIIEFKNYDYVNNPNYMNLSNNLVDLIKST